MHAQAMSAADPQARWLMQAWLFYDNQDFWKPPQIKASTSLHGLFILLVLAKEYALHLMLLLIGKLTERMLVSEVRMSACNHTWESHAAELTYHKAERTAERCPLRPAGAGQRRA